MLPANLSNLWTGFHLDVVIKVETLTSSQGKVPNEQVPAECGHGPPVTANGRLELWANHPGLVNCHGLLGCRASKLPQNVRVVSRWNIFVRWSFRVLLRKPHERRQPLDLQRPESLGWNAAYVVALAAKIMALSDLYTEKWCVGRWIGWTFRRACKDCWMAWILSESLFNHLRWGLVAFDKMTKIVGQEVIGVGWLSIPDAISIEVR